MPPLVDLVGKPSDRADNLGVVSIEVVSPADVDHDRRGSAANQPIKLFGKNRPSSYVHVLSSRHNEC